MVNTIATDNKPLEGKITSYISVFNIRDVKGDIVTDTAFDSTWSYLQNRIATGKMYVHWNHYNNDNYISNIGIITAIIKNARGLVATIQLNEKGKSIMPLLYMKYNAKQLFSSIEFMLSQNAKTQNINNTRYIIDGILLEGIALLTDPANKQATVLQFKNDKNNIETICNQNPMMEYKSDNEIEINVNINSPKEEETNCETDVSEENNVSEDTIDEIDVNQQNFDETIRCLQQSKILIKNSSNISEEEKGLYINRVNRLRKNLTRTIEPDIEEKGYGKKKMLTKSCGNKKKMLQKSALSALETKSAKNIKKNLDKQNNVCQTLNTSASLLSATDASNADSGHTAVPSSSRDAVLKVHPLTALSKFYKK